MLKLIAGGVEKRPKTIILTVLIITIIISASLVRINVVEEVDENGNKTTKYETEPAISFKTDIDKFLPDNPVVRANNRVQEKFGADFLPHVIYAEVQNPEANILDPKAIREMYFATEAAKAQDGVEGTISFADVINTFSKYRSSPGSNETRFDDWYNLGRLNHKGTDYIVTDDDIQNYLDLLFGIMNGSLNISLYADIFGQVPLLNMFDDIDFIFDMIHLILSEDYTLESQKAQATLIIVQLNGILSNIEAKEVAGSIRNAVDELEFNEIKTRQTSQYLISYDIDVNSIETFQFLAVGIFGLIILILALSFRKLTYVIFPILTLIIATIWTIGTMYFLDLSVTAMMVAVIPLLIGLGVDYSVHVLRRYQEELRKGVSVDKAIRESIINVGGAIGLATVTTMIAFLSNLTSAVTPIRDFGIACAAGVFYAFILTMTFHCAARSLMDKKALNKFMKTRKGKNPLFVGSWHTEKDSKMGIYDKFSNVVSKAVLKAPIPIAILTIVLTIGAVVAAANVESEFTMEEFLPNDWDSVQTSYILREDFEIGSFSTAYILIEGDNVATNQTFFGIEDTINRLDDDEHVVKIEGDGEDRTMAFSILDLSGFMVALNSSLETEFNLTPDGLPNVTCTDSDIRAYFDYIYYNDTAPVGNDTFGSYVKQMIYYNEKTDMYEATVIRVFTSTFTSTDTRNMFQELKEDINGVNYGPGNKATITGLMVLTIDVIDSLQTNMINSTFLAVILAAIILIVLYKSITLGILPPIPVILCSIWILGTMYILSYSLNILTVMVTALTIGLGIDYSIHVMERFREERKNNKGISESIHTTIMSTGTALTISAVTTILGFGVLLFSPMPIAQQFGVITAITIIFSFLAAVLVLPVILIAWAKRKEKKDLKGLPSFSSMEKIDSKKVKKGK